MKLHFHPVSTTSRAVLLFCAEEKISYEPVFVDLMKGAHYQDDFIALNASAQVPVLEDDGFVLTESSAILKYLAEKTGSAAYPKDLKARARVNEVMDWFNTGLYRELGYHLAYPQLFAHHKRPSEAAQQGTLEWGQQKIEHWLGCLDKRILGSKKYLCGDEITIADYFGAALITSGDLIGASFARYPNVDRWLSTMRALPSWRGVHEAHDGFAASLKGKPFVTVA